MYLLQNISYKSRMNSIMKKTAAVIVFIAIIAVYTYFLISYKEVKYSVIKNIDVFHEAIQKENINDLIIDLRDQEDYEKEHIDKSINMPFNDEGVKLLSYLKEKKLHNKNIYLLCYSGNRSAKAFNLLSDEGFKNINYIAFGYDEYKESLGNSFIPVKGPCPCGE